MGEGYLVPDLAPGEIHRVEDVIRRSRFIATFARVSSTEEAKAFLERIRAEHAQATHNCWAFVAGEPGSTAQVGASDDGEPKGTAGRPMLTALLHSGVGEVAVSDHRSSQPTFEEFARIAADARVAGMLSGKAGIVNVHLGDSARKMDLIERVIHETEIPASQFLPTHVNRNAALFDNCLELAKEGLTIDFTGNEDIDYWETICDEVRVCRGIRRLLDLGISSDRFTISSDGQGSMPVFNAAGEYQGIGIGKASCLLKEVRECVQKEGIPLEIAVKGITSNVASVLKLGAKGQLKAGFDADICLLAEDSLELKTVMAKGQFVVRDGVQQVFGTFERA